MTTPRVLKLRLLMKVAENFFTSINNKVICKETEVTVTC